MKGDHGYLLLKVDSHTNRYVSLFTQIIMKKGQNKNVGKTAFLYCPKTTKLY